MDQEQLNLDIFSTLPDDPLYIAHLRELKPCWQSLPMDFSAMIVSYTSLIPMTSGSEFFAKSTTISSPDIPVRIRQWTSSAAIIPGPDSVNLSRNIVNLVQQSQTPEA